jgi:5-amino-6-(5-phospho-D-ribitylamino)uracil phosphatase
MNRWQLIALDMDGTLLRRDGTVSAENRKWIQKAREQGIEVTLATGRHIRSALPYMEELGFTAPVVTSNGGEVWTADLVLLERHPLPLEDVRFLHEIALQYKKYGTHIWANTINEIVHWDTFPEKIEQMIWLKFGYQNNDLSVIQEILHRLQAYGRFEITNSDPRNIEVNPAGINKASGLQTVCEHLRISPSRVVTMGDSLNDVAMLRWAGMGIAMGNAQEEVKAAADSVTASHEQDGVARAIERLLVSEVS